MFKLGHKYIYSTLSFLFLYIFTVICSFLAVYGIHIETVYCTLYFMDGYKLFSLR